MKYLVPSCVLLLAVGLSYCQEGEFQYDCTGLPENFRYWWACGSYGICRSGHYAQIDCVNGTVYDRRHGDCVQASEAVTFPCNSVPENCLVYNGPGHRYPDQDLDPVENFPPCTFYYTCSYGRYLGHQRCSEGTVYDEPQQRCLSASEVAPPCGTLQGGRTYPFQGGPNQVVQPQVDINGNPDLGKWPFTTNNNNNNNNRQRNPRQTVKDSNRNQRLFYRSADRAVPQDLDSNDFNNHHLEGEK